MIEQLGNGLLLGVIIALGSVALSLLYGVTRIVNFAHGEIIAFGAMMTLFFSSSPDSSLLFLDRYSPLGNKLLYINNYKYCFMRNFWRFFRVIFI